MKKSNGIGEEEIYIKLKNLYESYGYERYRMRRFEEYAMYLASRNFFVGESIITFTDATGKLLALKPDVTLSIAKRTNATERKSEKLYYKESVFRFDKRLREYREITQMGAEFLGSVDLLSSSELLLMALDTLKNVSDNFVLDVSDTGVLSGVTSLLPEEIRGQALSALCAKNSAEIERLCDACGVNENIRKALLLLINIDSFDKLNKIETLISSDEISSAIKNLRDIGEVFSSVGGYSDRVRLDFSIINDLDYYNGLIFQGYVEEVPRAVLYGGRYDNLMRFFGKSVGAMGFALYIDELAEEEERKTDSALLLSDGNVSQTLYKAAALRRDGKCVRVESEFYEEKEGGERV